MDPNGTIEAKAGKPLIQLLDNPEIDSWKLLDENPVTSISDLAAFQKKFEYLQTNYQVS